MKKIAIDARMMGLEHAGIGRYVENLVKELKKSKQLELVFLKSRARHYSLNEQLLMPFVISRSGADLIHFPHFNVPLFCPKPFVVTIHDLIKHQSRGSTTTTRLPLFYWLKYIAYLFVFWLAVKRAKKIIVPSQTVKKELLKRYRLPPEKVVVIYEGVSKEFIIHDSRFKIRKPFVIYTGSLYPHKNIERLIKAVLLIEVPLKIVCSRNVFSKRLEEKVRLLEAENLVEFLGFIPDKKLVSLYHQAIALVQPSLMEGFDLTVVEAMASGLPVIISDIPVHREIAGKAAVYFNPGDVNQMTEKIKLVIKDKKLRNNLIKKGLEKSKRYSWQKMAKETLKIYQSCLDL